MTDSGHSVTFWRCGRCGRRWAVRVPADYEAMAPLCIVHEDRPETVPGHPFPFAVWKTDPVSGAAVAKYEEST